MKKERLFRAATSFLMPALLFLSYAALVFGHEPAARRDQPSRDKRVELLGSARQPGLESQTDHPASRDGWRSTGTANGECTDLSGKWRITTSEGSSIWEFRRADDSVPMYNARETSPGNARGMAGLLDGNLLRLEFDVRTETGERYSGIYRCKLDENCQSSLSPCKLVLGEGRTGTYEATIKRQ